MARAILRAGVATALAVLGCGGVVVGTGGTGDALGTGGTRTSGTDTGGAGTGGAGLGGSSGADTGGATAGNGGSVGTTTIEFSINGAFCKQGCGPLPSINIFEFSSNASDGFLGAELAVNAAGDTCASLSCPAIPCLPDVIVTTTALFWDGTYYVPSPCGDGTSCQTRRFAPSGTYWAQLCATPGNMQGQTCVPSGPVKCNQVEFPYPQDGVVKETLGP